MKNLIVLATLATLQLSMAGSATAQLSTPSQPSLELLEELPSLKKSTLPANPTDEQILAFAPAMRSSLLGSPDRIGYGAKATGGQNAIIVRNWSELVSAAQASGNYIIIHPNTRMPMIGDRSLLVRNPNVTIDGSLVPGGATVEVNDVMTRQPSYLMIVDGGNFILHNLKVTPQTPRMEVGVLRLRKGSDYWIDHYEVEGQFKDDALSIGQRYSGDNIATNITVSNYRVSDTTRGILVSGLIRSDRPIYYTVHKSYLNAKDRNPRSNAAVGHFFNNYIASGPAGSGGSGMTSILSGTVNGVFRGVILSESNVFDVGNNNKGNPTRTQFTCTAGSDVGTMLELSDGKSNGYINSDGLSIFAGNENNDATTYRGCPENFNNSSRSFKVPYKYSKMPANQVLDYVRSNAGTK